MLNRYFVAHKTKKWIDVIDKIAENYNNTPHDTVGARPIDLFQKRVMNQQNLFKNEPQILSVDTKVRIETPKGIFDKGSEPRFSREIYTIEQKIKNGYILKNISTGKLTKKTLSFARITSY